MVSIPCRIFLWDSYKVCVDRYEKSAETYALTQHSFEEVTLKFINLEQKEALKQFLIHKLAGLKKSVSTGSNSPWITFSLLYIPSIFKLSYPSKSKE